MSLTLLAVVLMLVLVTKWLRIYREQLLMELRNRQNRHAVCRINQRIYRGLHPRSFGMKTDGDYLEKLMTTYPSVPAEDWKKYLCIVQKAVFFRRRDLTGRSTVLLPAVPEVQKPADFGKVG